MSEDEIQTPRLVLRKWKEEDADDMFPLASDPIIGQMCGWKPHTSTQDSLDFIRSTQGKEIYALILRSIGSPVGCIGAEPTTIKRAKEGDMELGYWVGMRYWNNGYATEASSTLIDHLFDNGVKRIWCQHREDNPASGRVQEKCGFRFDHKAVSSNPVVGEVVVSVSRLDRKDWLKNR